MAAKSCCQPCSPSRHHLTSCRAWYLSRVLTCLHQPLPDSPSYHCRLESCLSDIRSAGASTAENRARQFTARNYRPISNLSTVSISFWGIQLTKWNTSFQKHSFSSSGFPEWGAYTVKTFNKRSTKTIFSTRIISQCLSTLTTLSTHFSATNIPTPSVFASLPVQNSLYLLPVRQSKKSSEVIHGLK